MLKIRQIIAVLHPKRVLGAVGLDAQLENFQAAFNVDEMCWESLAFEVWANWPRFTGRKVLNSLAAVDLADDSAPRNPVQTGLTAAVALAIDANRFAYGERVVKSCRSGCAIPEG